jgi:hypothetical protein
MPKQLLPILLLAALAATCGRTSTNQLDALEEEVDELRYALQQANERIEQTASELEDVPACPVDAPEPVPEP